MTTVQRRRVKAVAVFASFVTPLLVFYTIFFLLPLLSGFRFSFTDWNGLTDSWSFVGFGNYVRALTSDSFYYSLGRTLVFAISYVLGVNILGLAFALLLNKNLAGKRIYRSLIFMPNAISLVIVSFIWLILFTQLWRSVADTTQWSWMGFSWFGNGGTAMAAIVITFIWQSVGFYMVIFTAGLQMISDDYYEAADMDGASGWFRFRHITFPLIMPSVTVTLFMATSIAFKMFAIFFLMTEGGPGRSTEVLAMNVYNEAFVTGRAGFASAKAILLFILVLAITQIQIRFTKDREVEL
jgi:raffinose/stachyose/melibiose transport system permease protein